MLVEGAYTAARASALSGVPLRTIHDWASKRLVPPSVWPKRTRLWSYRDLMLFRVLHWLRQRKQTESGDIIKATSMRAVRDVIAFLDELEVRGGLWSADSSPIRVDLSGKVFVVSESGTYEGPQLVADDMLDLIAPFEETPGLRGPNLLQPRAHLRIVPGKLSGAPHVVGTRVETEAVAALATRGFGLSEIGRFYPFVTQEALEESIDLERQLSSNERRAKAAA